VKVLIFSWLRRPRKWVFGIIGLFLSILVAHPVISAERIYFSYGFFERSVPIESLETFVETSEVDSELAFYARQVTSDQLSQFRQVLQSEIPLDVVTVSQFLYTPIGERLLNRLGEVIQTEARQSGFYGIRAALILAAADPQGFTPLAVLRQFPTDGIRIDIAQGLAIADDLQALVSRTNQATNLIQQQAQTEAAATPFPSNSLTTNLWTSGPYRWEVQTFTLTDSKRNRSFPVDIYLPRLSDTRPLVVISHGLGSDRESFAYLARHLASYGFVVAVPEHPGSNADQLQALFEGIAERVTNPREFIDRPLDITYLLDELDRLSRSNSVLQGRLSLQNVGVIGQSFGGYTALALAGARLDFEQLQSDCRALNDSLNLSLVLQCLALQLPKQTYDLADPRIGAAIAVNPVDSSIMGQRGLSQIQVPTMIVTGSADTVAPALPEQIQPFTWLTTSNRYLLLLDGGTHFSATESSDAGIPIPTSVVGPEPALARRYLEALSMAFFQVYLADQLEYRPYLSAAYANRISQNPMPLSLVQSLPLPEELTSYLDRTPVSQCRTTDRSHCHNNRKLAITIERVVRHFSQEMPVAI